MSQERINLGFGQELEELDPTSWAPKPKKAKEPRPSRDELTQATQAAGFRSREPKTPKPSPRTQRRGRRTGRTQQFTTKTTPDYYTLIYRIADGEIDGQPRLVGEVLEQAIDALMQQIEPKKAGRG